MSAEPGPLVYRQLAAVMADVDHVAKRDRNSQQGFSFRGIDAVVNAVGPVLRKHQVLVVPHLQHVEYRLGQSRQGGGLTNAQVVVRYVFYAVDGSSLECTVAAEAFDSGDKATAKAMSVAFRTALLQALALPTDEPDPDSQVYEQEAPGSYRQQPPPRQQQQRQERPREERPPEQPRAISQAQTRMMGALMGQLGMGSADQRDAALAYVADVIGRTVGSRNELTSAEATRVIDALKADVEGQPPPDAPPPPDPAQENR